VHCNKTAQSRGSREKDARDGMRSSRGLGQRSPVASRVAPQAPAEPIEYEYYMKKAHEMRAASMASMLVGFFARLKRIFARAHPAQRRHEPVLIKRAV
jgi:hypothetical protein